MDLKLAVSESKSGRDRSQDSSGTHPNYQSAQFFGAHFGPLMKFCKRDHQHHPPEH